MCVLKRGKGKGAGNGQHVFEAESSGTAETGKEDLGAGDGAEIHIPASTQGAEDRQSEYGAGARHDGPAAGRGGAAAGKRQGPGGQRPQNAERGHGTGEPDAHAGPGQNDQGEVCVSAGGHPERERPGGQGRAEHRAEYHGHGAVSGRRPEAEPGQRGSLSEKRAAGQGQPGAGADQAGKGAAWRRLPGAPAGPEGL